MCLTVSHPSLFSLYVIKYNRQLLRLYNLHWSNKLLKRIGEVERVGLGGKKVITPLFPHISTYWARHTWATIAASIEIPKETISHALGHGNDTVTDIYIDFDMNKVDEANEKVINYCFTRLVSKQ